MNLKGSQGVQEEGAKGSLSARGRSSSEKLLSSQ